MADVFAKAKVTTRHLLDGKQMAEDRVTRRTVYKNKKGEYYIRVLGYKQIVDRVEGTDEFLLIYNGRTVKKGHIII